MNRKSWPRNTKTKSWKKAKTQTPTSKTLSARRINRVEVKTKKDHRVLREKAAIENGNGVDKLNIHLKLIKTNQNYN